MQEPVKTETPSPIVWTIGGSDSGGGAGIQADLKVMNAFGVHGCSIITALTAQNTLEVQASQSTSEAMLSAQLGALTSDLPPAAIKTGMLGSTATCRILADYFHSAEVPIVCDPVLQSTSGTDLLAPEALDILIRDIIPKVALLTPNLPEAAVIIGHPIQSVEDTAIEILKLGAGSVLIKGGHSDSSECRDYWTDGEQAFWLSSPRIETSATHGTGCILSSAIAAAIGIGTSLPNAVIEAKTFLNQCLKSPAHVGSGHGPMVITPFRNDLQDRPARTIGTS